MFSSGGLLDAPPSEVEPSNGTAFSSADPANNMSRLNGRVHHAGTPSNPVQYQPVPTQHTGQQVAQYREEYEPSCLVRTPSGNVYIPTGRKILWFEAPLCLGPRGRWCANRLLESFSAPHSLWSLLWFVVYRCVITAFWGGL